MDAPALFELDAVGFERSGRHILADVTWSVAAGDRWAVLGPNGCGKSTLLKLAMGRLWPTSGLIRRQGEELCDLPALWRRLGWIADTVAREIPAREPARDTVASGIFAQTGLKLFPGFEPTPADHDRAAAELDRLGCAALADRPFGVLSQGERQKVLVARALVADPLCLVLDEPCAGMDPGAREQFLGWLATHLCAGGPAVILVTHHVEEILPVFDRTLILREGRVLARGATADVLTRDAFEALYGTRLDRLEKCGGRHWPIWAGAGTSVRQGGRDRDAGV